MIRAMIDRNPFNVYVDSDGVLADFNRFIQSKNPNINLGQRGCGLEITRIMIDYGAEFYANFDVVPNREGLFLNIIENSNWFVLTALPRKQRLLNFVGEDEALQLLRTYKENKYRWYETHGVKRSKVIILNSADLKASYAYKNSVFFDDYAINIEKWNKNGGVGILVTDSMDLSRSEYVQSLIEKTGPSRIL